jgi:hypothetical protein
VSGVTDEVPLLLAMRSANTGMPHHRFPSEHAISRRIVALFAVVCLYVQRLLPSHHLDRVPAPQLYKIADRQEMTCVCTGQLPNSSASAFFYDNDELIVEHNFGTEGEVAFPQATDECAQHLWSN